MSLKMKAKSGGGNFENPEPGNQAAVLVAIIDLGTVQKPGFKGGKPYDAHEVFLVWELVTQQMTGSSNNHVIGRSYTATLGEKANLRNMISKWRGKPITDGEDFDLATLLGKSCLLDVQSTEDGKYTKLDALCASNLPKGMECPPAKRKPVVWEIDNNDQLPEHLDWLPFLYGESPQDRIARSGEWKSKKASGNGHSSASGDEGSVDELADDDSQGNEYPNF